MRCLVTQQAAKLQSYFCCTTRWLLWVYVDFKSSSRNMWTKTLPWYFRKNIKNTLCFPLTFLSGHSLLTLADPIWLFIDIHTSIEPPLVLSICQLSPPWSHSVCWWEHVSLCRLITDYCLSAGALANTWKPTSSLLVAEMTENAVNCTQPPGTHIWRRAKTSLPLWICITLKFLYFPRDLSDRLRSHIIVRKHPCPRELIGYQPWKGNTGRGLQVRSWRCT